MDAPTPATSNRPDGLRVPPHATSRPDEQEFRSWLHPDEPARARLANVGGIGAGAVALLLLLLSLGTLLLPLLLVVAAVWLTQRLAEAHLLGQAILVSPHSFPELDARIRETCDALAYDKPVRAFVVDDGEINAALRRFSGRRYLALNSGLVASMTRAEQAFVIGRFVGALRARHLRYHELAGVVEGFQKLWLLNLLVLPYLRTTVLSGDRIGLRLCGDPAAALRALDKLIIGKDLADRLDPVGIEEQAAQLDRSLFKGLAQLFMAHPFHTDRYLALRRYAQEQAPACA